MSQQREYYTVKLKCRICGREGTARMSDAKSFNERGGYDTRAETLPSGFEARGNDIICTKCNVTAL